MAKSKALTVKKPKLHAADRFFDTQGVAEEGAMSNFHEAVRRAMPEVIEKAIAEVASLAFGDGVGWANNTPMTKAERKSIA